MVESLDVHLDDPTAIELRRRIHVVVEWTAEQKQNICDNVLRLFMRKFGGGMPRIMQRISEDAENICYDENFWRRIGLPYCEADKHLMTVAAAAADFYYSQLIMVNNTAQQSF